MRTQKGFTLIELLVVISIIATLAGLVTILVSTSWGKTHILECTNNVRELTGALETLDTGSYPAYSGPNLLLVLVRKEIIGGRDGLEVLFCPGDLEENLEQAGGVEAYANIDLARKGEYGQLTSYAARDQTTPGKRARKGAVPAQVLIADDSEDHHERKGVVIGLTGGSVKFREKLDDYKLSRNELLIVGEGSQVPELACLVR